MEGERQIKGEFNLRGKLFTKCFLLQTTALRERSPQAQANEQRWEPGEQGGVARQVQARGRRRDGGQRQLLPAAGLPAPAAADAATVAPRPHKWQVSLQRPERWSHDDGSAAAVPVSASHQGSEPPAVPAAAAATSTA